MRCPPRRFNRPRLSRLQRKAHDIAASYLLPLPPLLEAARTSTSAEGLYLVALKLMHDQDREDWQG